MFYRIEEKIFLYQFKRRQWLSGRVLDLMCKSLSCYLSLSGYFIIALAMLIYVSKLSESKLPWVLDCIDS